MHPSLNILNNPFVIMGIVNITPDSFFDGGTHATAEAAINHAETLIAEGAHILDIGGESSRPGALPVPEDEECRRILPIIETIANKFSVPISVDTYKAHVAKRALNAGASWINDISAGRLDPAMAALAAGEKCPVVLMHSRQTPQTMQTQPFYRDVVAEVKCELMERVNYFCNAGVIKENIILDPGFGFAKRSEDNLTLMRNLKALHGLGYPLLIGTSRKAFVGNILGEKAPQERLFGSLATLAPAFSQGVKIFRVHDVKASCDFLKVYAAVTDRI